MTGTHLVLDTASDSIGKIISVVVVHFMCQGNQFLNRSAHGLYFLVGAPTAFTILTFFGAFTIAWIKFHIFLPLFY